MNRETPLERIATLEASTISIHKDIIKNENIISRLETKIDKQGEDLKKIKYILCIIASSLATHIPGMKNILSSLIGLL